MMLPHKSMAGVALLFAALEAGAATGQPIDPQAGSYTPPASSQSPPLRVEVIGGTSFRDVETGDVYRLYGVDACDPDQIARRGRQAWPCGTVAIAWLVTATLNNWLACATVRQESGIRLARCATATYPDLAEAMLREGVAVVAPPSDTSPAVRRYAEAERAARRSQRGIWSSTFDMPWHWRDRNRDAKSEVGR
ncbi:thermonuclease family protein [Rhodopseudomonas parapalustris]